MPRTANTCISRIKGVIGALVIVAVTAVASASSAGAVGLTPIVTSVSPSKGPVAGGTTVSITGENFTATNAVKFGSSSAASFTVNSATSITAVSPPEPAGAVNVTVGNPVFTSATSFADEFTYVPGAGGAGNVAGWGVSSEFELGALWESAGGQGPTLFPVGSVVQGAVQVASGFQSGYALMPTWEGKQGVVLSWGGDLYYQLGHGWRANPNGPQPNGNEGKYPPPSESEGFNEERSPNPRPVVGTNWTASNHAALENVASIADETALLNNGEVRTWGPYLGGRIGNGTDGELEQFEESAPIPVSPTLGSGGPNLSGITAIAAAGGTRLALNNEGRVFGWGFGYGGMLGAAGTARTLYPVEIQGVSNVVEVALGSDHVQNGHSLFLVRKPNGETEILAIGSNKHDELGNSSVSEAGTRTPVPVMKGGEVLRHVVGIAASDLASYALVEPKPGEREVFAWGRNNGGALGIGSTSPATSATPLKVIGPNGEANFPQPITFLHAGSYFGQVVAAGKLFAWGGNLRGQIGDGTELNKPTPLEVRQWGGAPMPSYVLSVSGYETVLALLEGAVPTHMMTATLENNRSQMTVTWETPEPPSEQDIIELRIVPEEQIEHWKNGTVYAQYETVEDKGSATEKFSEQKQHPFWIATHTIQNPNLHPYENTAEWSRTDPRTSEAVKQRKGKPIRLTRSQRSRTFVLPFGPAPQPHNPFYKVILEETLASKERGGAWGQPKDVVTQWMN